MILLEAIAAGVVGAALLWLVLEPILFPTAAAPELADIPEPEETARGQALLALKEIEFDRATGKLSDADYTSLHARYTAAALVTLADDSVASDRVEALIAERVATQTGGAFCTQCGARLPANAKFCESCGCATG
ncbi:MAG: zinc ribbon domain-containing protein [Gemmatimonadota bacterium]